MTIGETAGTFKSVVRPLNLNEVSYVYRVFFDGTEDTVLRFDLPQGLTTRIGSHYNGGFVYITALNQYLGILKVSSFDSDDSLGKCNCFLYKPRGNPQSNNLNADDDAQFICIPKDQTDFKEGDKIVYSLVKETEEEERYIRVERVS
jgi:hypothetical protein